MGIHGVTRLENLGTYGTRESLVKIINIRSKMRFEGMSNKARDGNFFRKLFFLTIFYFLFYKFYKKKLNDKLFKNILNQPSLAFSHIYVVRETAAC